MYFLWWIGWGSWFFPSALIPQLYLLVLEVWPLTSAVIFDPKRIILGQTYRSTRHRSTSARFCAFGVHHLQEVFNKKPKRHCRIRYRQYLAVIPSALIALNYVWRIGTNDAFCRCYHIYYVTDRHYPEYERDEPGFAETWGSRAIDECPRLWLSLTSTL